MTMRERVARLIVAGELRAPVWRDLVDDRDEPWDYEVPKYGLAVLVRASGTDLVMFENREWQEHFGPNGLLPPGVVAGCPRTR